MTAYSRKTDKLPAHSTKIRNRGTGERTMRAVLRNMNFPLMCFFPRGATSRFRSDASLQETAQGRTGR